MRLMPPLTHGRKGSTMRLMPPLTHGRKEGSMRLIPHLTTVLRAREASMPPYMPPCVPLVGILPGIPPCVYASLPYCATLCTCLPTAQQ